MYTTWFSPIDWFWSQPTALIVSSINNSNIIGLIFRKDLINNAFIYFDELPPPPSPPSPPPPSMLVISSNSSNWFLMFCLTFFAFSEKSLIL